MQETMDRSTVDCTSLLDLTKTDMEALGRRFPPYAETLADRVLAHLQNQKNFGRPGFRIDRYEHALQTATRALKDGRDDEYVVAALLHDIGDGLCIYNHADMAAVVLRPFVSDDIHWMIYNHEVFQGYYFNHHMGKDRNLRDQFKSHRLYAMTEEFCAAYDSPAFDPAYKSEPIETFIPAVRRVLAKPRAEYKRRGVDY